MKRGGTLLANGCHDTYDSHPIVGFRLIGKADASADGILAGPEAAGEGFVHHCDGRGMQGVVVVEGAAPHNWDSHGAKVSGTDGRLGGDDVGRRLLIGE